MVAVQNLKEEGGMYLVSTTPTKLLIDFLWNFTQPADVHEVIPLLSKI